MSQTWRDAMPGQWLVGLHVLVKPAVTPRGEVPPLVRRTIDEETAWSAPG